MKAFLIILLPAILFLSCDILNPKDDAPKNDPYGGYPSKIKYSLAGTSNNYSLTYEKNGSTEQIDPANNQWVCEWWANKEDFLYISAQNNLDHGTVEVYLYRNGVLLKNAKSDGAYVIATADCLNP